MREQMQYLPLQKNSECCHLLEYHYCDSTNRGQTLPALAQNYSMNFHWGHSKASPRRAWQAQCSRSRALLSRQVLHAADSGTLQSCCCWTSRSKNSNNEIPCQPQEKVSRNLTEPVQRWWEPDLWINLLLTWKQGCFWNEKAFSSFIEKLRVMGNSPGVLQELLLWNNVSSWI